jgi:excisionase family DNA binding protein
MEERHVPLSTVAGRLGVSERTVRRWIKAGKLKATRPGRDYRIPESALRELVEEGEVSPKAPAPPSQRSLFNGEERRAFIERCERYVAARVAHYEHRLAEAKRGSLFAGFVGAKTLRDEAFEEFSQLLDLQNGELAERWINDPEVPEAVKEELGFDLTEVQKPFIQVVGRIGDRASELAETQAQKVEAGRLHDELAELRRRKEARHEHRSKTA